MNKLARYIIAIAATALIVFLIWYFGDIVCYILVAAVLSVMGQPLVDILCRIKIRSWKFSRWLAALLVLILIMGVAAALFALFIPLIASKLHELQNVNFKAVTDSLQQPIARVEHFLQTFFSVDMSGFSVYDTITNYIADVFDFGQLNAILSSFLSVVANVGIALFSVIFITYFFLKEDSLFTNMMLAVTPTRYEENIRRGLSSTYYLLSRYFVGLVAECTLMMLMVSAGLLIGGFDVSNAFFIGLIVGVLKIVPYLGSWISAAISIVVGFTFDMGAMSVGNITLWILGAIVVAELIDNFLVQPFLYSERVKAHPLEIFLVILIAGKIGGVVGMLVAIPAYTVLRVFAKEFLYNYKLVQKLTRNIDLHVTPETEPEQKN